MKKTVAVLLTGAFALASMFALADDRTASDMTPAEQAKMNQEANAAKAAKAKMTPEQRAAARKARDAKAQADQNTIIKLTQNPGENRNMSINKSAEASKAGPMPQKNYINTPEAEQKMYKNKGQ